MSMNYTNTNHATVDANVIDITSIVNSSYQFSQIDWRCCS